MHNLTARFPQLSTTILRSCKTWLTKHEHSTVIHLFATGLVMQLFTTTSNLVYLCNTNSQQLSLSFRTFVLIHLQVNFVYLDSQHAFVNLVECEVASTQPNCLDGNTHMLDKSLSIAVHHSSIMDVTPTTKFFGERCSQTPLILDVE